MSYSSKQPTSAVAASISSVKCPLNASNNIPPLPQQHPRHSVPHHCQLILHMFMVIQPSIVPCQQFLKVVAPQALFCNSESRMEILVTIF
jgi:hypothetical protein